jgi:biotin operon repressor
MLQGIQGIDEQAERVGVSAAEIEKARRRLKAQGVDLTVTRKVAGINAIC